MFAQVLVSLFVVSQQLAFPTATGAGAYATGGRGGQVLIVSNLNDSGPGSLRDALMQTFPRIIVFEVSGTIHLESSIELIEENSNFTVAGQTAPEGGITIAGHLIQLGGGYYRAPEPCNNVIWRYIRFRNGGYTGVPDVREHNGLISGGTDGLIFDHCSFSFCDDQALSMGGEVGDFRNITIQRSVFSENATGIIAGLSDLKPSGDLTSIYNLFVDQGHRTPNIGGTLQYDIINNVFFNWGSRLVNANANTPQINYIGNYHQPGDHTQEGRASVVQNISPEIYTANNYHPEFYPTPQLNDYGLWKDFYSSEPVSLSFFRETQFPLLGALTTILTPLEAYDTVLEDVGANRFLNADGTVGSYQDSFDVRKISNVRNGISSDPFNKSWTLPTLPTNRRAENYDSNRDGIPDQWKSAKGFDVNDDLSDHRWPSGYVGIEEFLNEVDQDAISNPPPDEDSSAKKSGCRAASEIQFLLFTVLTLLLLRKRSHSSAL